MTGLAYLGIDPGLNGYLALISDRHDGVSFWPMPTIGGKGSRREFDRAGILALVAGIVEVEASTRIVGVVERQMPMGRGSTLTAFKVGLGYGILTTALAAARVGFEEVAPADWKRRMRVTGQGKDAKARRADSKRRAIQKAQALFPGVELKRSAACKGPSDDKAEALLLAELARRGL